MPTRDRRIFRRVVIAIVMSAAVLTVASWPVTRFVGVNFVITQQKLPLWMKAVEFLDRDINLAQVSQLVLGPVQGDEAKAAAALAWTRANIRPTPPGFPIVDDHIWNIIVRGYGQSDQQADVFTTLLEYAGVRAYWMFAGDKPREIPLSYVRLGGKWRVYDVARGIVFKTKHGELATPEEIAADHDLIRAAAAPLVADVDAYVSHFTGYRVPLAPEVSRADLQRPGRRFWHQAKKLFGLQGREWQMREPVSAQGQAQ
jgi:hypothetical protein